MKPFMKNPEIFRDIKKRATSHEAALFGFEGSLFLADGDEHQAGYG